MAKKQRPGEYDEVVRRRTSDIATQLAYDEIRRSLSQADYTAGAVSDEAAAQIEANVTSALARHLTGASFAVDRIASRDGVVVDVTTVPLRGQALRMSNRFEVPNRAQQSGGVFQLRGDNLRAADVGNPIYLLDAATVTASRRFGEPAAGRLLRLNGDGSAMVALGDVASAPVAADQDIRVGAMVTRLSSGSVIVSASPTTTAQQVADAVNVASNTPPDALSLRAGPRHWDVATSALGRAAEATSATFSDLAGAMGSMQRAAIEVMRAREESMMRAAFLQSPGPRFDTFTSLSYSGNGDRAEVRGTSPMPLGVTRGSYSSTVDIVETSPGSSRLTPEQLSEVRRVVYAPTPPLICEAVEIAPSAPQRLLGELMSWLNEEVDMGDEALWQLNSEAAVTGHAVVYVPSRKALRVAARQELLQADAATWRQVDWKRSPLPP